MNYVYSTYLLEIAERQGTPVLNRPSSIRDCNEKLFALEFANCCPPHIVSANKESLQAFYEENNDVIFKPLDGMGGQSIFRAKPKEHNLCNSRKPDSERADPDDGTKIYTRDRKRRHQNHNA